LKVLHGFDELGKKYLERGAGCRDCRAVSARMEVLGAVATGFSFIGTLPLQMGMHNSGCSSSLLMILMQEGVGLQWKNLLTSACSQSCFSPTRVLSMNGLDVAIISQMSSVVAQTGSRCLVKPLDDMSFPTMV
jgi:hypothetical protein